MGKRPNGDDMISEQLNSLERKQNHLNNQLEIILRLIQGDSTLNTIRPTGLVNDVKEMDNRLKDIQKNTEEVVDWWNDRSKRKYIINVDLVAWGKVIAWVVGITGGLIGLIKWLSNPQK